MEGVNAVHLDWVDFRRKWQWGNASMQLEASGQNSALKDYKTVFVNEKNICSTSQGLIPAAAAAAELSLQITSTSKANRTFNHVCVKSPSGRVSSSRPLAAALITQIHPEAPH